MTAAAIFDLTGRTALITGRAEGLGKVMAEAGVRVALLDRNKERAHDLPNGLDGEAANLSGLALVIPNAGISEAAPRLLP